MAIVSQPISVYMGGAQRGTPIFLAETPLVAAASTFIAVPTGARKMIATLSVTGGMTSGFPTSVLARYNQDSGNNYRWIYPSLANDVVAPAPLAASDQTTPQQSSMLLANTSSAPAADVNLVAEFDVSLVAGVTREYRSFMTSVGAAAASSYVGLYQGWWTNTANVITRIDLLFGSNATGKVIWDVVF